MTDTAGQVERRVALTAADKKRMTVGELRRFVEALTEAGVADDVAVKGRTAMSGHLSKIEV